MTESPTVFIVDDDALVRDALTLLLEASGYRVEACASAEAFLEAYRPERPGCLVLDVNMPGMSGPELQAELVHSRIRLPVIFLTGHGDVPLAVRAIKNGAMDFLMKPIDGGQLLDRVQAGFREDARRRAAESSLAARREALGRLTQREQEVLARIVAGDSNKEIARRLGISHRTVEVHRARIMEKLGARTVLDLAAMSEGLHAGPGETGARES